MKKALLALTVVCGSAQAFTGNDLLQHLEGDSSRQYAGLMYIRGMVEGIVHTSGLLDKKVICIPEEVTLGQLRDIVHQDLTKLPTIRHNEAKYLIYGSMVKAWPCKPPR